MIKGIFPFSMRGGQFLLSVIFVILAVPALAAQSYSELDPASVVREGAPVAPPPQAVYVAPPLVFYTTQVEFDNMCPGLPVESFDYINSPGATGCNGPFNSATNDACYSPGALMPGFSMDAIPVVGDGSMVTIAAGFLGNPSVIVGPNFFDDNNEILFDQSVTGAGIEVTAPFATGASVTVNVFGVGNVFLGSFPIIVPLTPATQFIGITSTVPFDRLTFTGYTGDLFDNLSFGDCYSFRKEIVNGNDYNFDGIPDRVVEAGITNGATYLFGINYFNPGGPNVTIKDIVPREWDAIYVPTSPVPCSVIRADERRNLFSDNFITCYPGDSAQMIFLALARCGDVPGDPMCHPYECGAFYLNEGAQTWVGRSLLDQTDPICLAAVKDINGFGLDYTGAGDEDGDGVDDYTEACVNFTDPCDPGSNAPGRR